MGMEDRIVLDSTVLIDFLRGDPEQTSFVQEHELLGTLFTTVINAFELYIGAYRCQQKENNLRLVKELLSRLQILPLHPDIAQRAAEICAQLERDGNAIDFKDLLVGIIALDAGCSVKTDNKKHFNRIPGLKVV